MGIKMIFKLDTNKKTFEKWDEENKEWKGKQKNMGDK